MTKNKVIEVLKTIYDPEMPVDIWEMGLIYGIEIKDNNIKILMTLTAPNCPVAESLPMEVKMKLSTLPGINDVDVQVTFDPPWDESRLSEIAKLELGWL